MTTETIDTPVRKTITVKAPAARAFDVFTRGFDTWWPRGHHIGKAPLQEAIIETRAGGRCYSKSIDGSECDWGSVLVWEPPHRFVMAWQISPEWQYEPDLAKSSEVEIRFTPLADGSTRVDLEHRYFHRHGPGGAKVRTAVDSANGWGDLLVLFAAKVDEGAPG